MLIARKMNGTSLEIALEGRLDTTTAPKLEEALNSLEGVESLTLDLSKLMYISSAGVRVLLAANKTLEDRGGMKMTHVSDVVREVFEVTGLADMLTIE